MDYSSMKIIVIDDMVTLRQSIVSLLRSAGFGSIVQAADGAEAYEKIGIAFDEGEAFDLIFSDINMPKINGIDLVKKLKSEENHKDIPIVMISTENEAPIVMEAISAGAINYMLKPFTMETLSKKLLEINKHL